jgi:uncharacterized membrane protein YGL010W
MRTLEQHLTRYAAYHRDRRNIATHFVGIPMIVVGAFGLLARPTFDVAGFGLTPAAVALLLGFLFYARLDARFGLSMFAVLAPLLDAGLWLGAQPRSAWLGGAIGFFVVGWVIQFVGHAFEGRKPAFVDDLVGLLIGPLFLVAEAAFALGLRAALREAIEAEPGPTRSGPRPAVLDSAR